MTDQFFRNERRTWLRRLAASGAFGVAGLTGLIRRVQAAAKRPFPEGIQELKGEVVVNGAPAKSGTPIAPGDTVATGPRSHVVFVIGQDAYLLRERSRLQISGDKASVVSGQFKASVVKVLTLLSGKMLSSFSKGEKQIATSTVTVGIRGTAVYIEAEPTRSYVCTCYGETVLEAKGSQVTETIRATYHDAPRYIYAHGASETIVKAPVINHRDDELIMLEALLDRSPPFAGTLERHY